MLGGVLIGEESLSWSGPLFSHQIYGERRETGEASQCSLLPGNVCHNKLLYLVGNIYIKLFKHCLFKDKYFCYNTLSQTFQFVLWYYTNVTFHSRYDMMCMCWNGVPEKRPTFSELVTVISTSLEGMTGYLDLISPPLTTVLSSTAEYDSLDATSNTARQTLSRNIPLNVVEHSM